MKINKTSIPVDSLVCQFFPANYSDAFECSFNSQKEINPDDLQIAFWTKSPKWIDNLFKIRNRLVQLVGLDNGKSRVEDLEDCIRNNKKHSIFSVACKSENETVMKLSDKHLDAYMSIYVSDKEDNLKTVCVITVVHIHNLLGYLYFYSICPFHQVVVKGMLKYLIQNLSK